MQRFILKSKNQITLLSAILIATAYISKWVSMSVGMLVHELSILVVIINGMRLLGFRLRK